MTEQAGQWRIAQVDLSDFGGDTVATLTIIKPDDTTLTPAVTGTDGNAHWESDDPYQLVAGEIIERWTVTGTGKTTIDHTFQVDPVANPDTGARVYATSTDYANLLHVAPPAGIRRKLIEASREIDQMLLSAFYDTDDDGMPTDAEVIIAMRDAACYQAEYAADIGDENSVGANQYHSVAIATVNLTRGYGPDGSSAPAKWSQKAWQVLQRAGLTNGEPWTS